MKKIIICIIISLLSINVCFAETVIYNVKTHKIHKPSCASAKSCTTNCIKIDKKEAQLRGGVPCKNCGG